MDELEKKIKEIISEQLGVSTEKILNNYSISGNLGADSLDIMELIMSVEEYFNILIKDEQIKKINTVDDIINCVIQTKSVLQIKGEKNK